ncbi:NAD(P)-binding protein [Punctularia strigosozonata HHB-11173 SS5]|uniref:NAD(P)-binding protein n=1 Tax=Punctularia strigosozonata (strain HHB-11173) TaxID=741275 RepID=UPI000441729A|nr:NAD(P)-binding protein [Punctularia strigosozonata HHB-11173 SS5]EIN05646.1 NAD(P)-binding protein [Punctularia strigosozonata HHB-11173 SS5]
MAPKRTAQGIAKSDSKSPATERKILITAAEGQTGRLVVDLLATHEDYVEKYASLTALVFSEEAKSFLDEYEDVQVLVYDPKDQEALVKNMEEVDTCLLIPPARKDKAKITRTLLEAAKKAKSVTNLVFLSSAGCDYAEKDKQPRLREFIELETLAMAAKSDSSSEDTGHSPCIIRAGFYAENLLLYTKQAREQGKLPLPIDSNHKFAPVALGDVAQLAAYVLTSVGPHGLADEVRGQMMVATGPMMVAGPELASAASEALGSKLEFESVTESKAKQILKSPQGEEIDEAEKEYLLEYYSLVREGKTNYVSTSAFHAIFGHRGQEPAEFFKVYSEEFKPTKRRKVAETNGSKAKVGAKGGAKTRSKKAKDEDEEME